ncbi:MAG TPA: hypothetical protein DCE78_11460 [Bacteroidetes bacterium]|nr:hypothetical protein [Bacteroidota bacterium]
MKLTERLIWLFAVLISLVFYFTAHQEVKNVESWIEQQNNELTLLDNALDSLVNDADSISLGSSALTTDHLYDSDIRTLKNRGLDDPIRQIKQDLMEKSELISFDGILGGTMRIYQEEQIILLPGFYAMAVFEDGHIQGGMLLEYEVNMGEIKWTVIKTKLF